MSYIAMDLVHGFQTKSHNKLKNVHKTGIELNSNTHLIIIRLSDSWVLKVIARFAILSLVLLSCPWLGSIIGGLTSDFQGSSNSDPTIEFGSMNVDLLPLIFHDLMNEGLIKMGDRAVFLKYGDDEAIYNSQILSYNEMDLVSYSDSAKQSLIPDETFDFAFTFGFHGSKNFIDRTLKLGGIAIIQLSDDPMNAFPKPSNYQIVYLRRFDSTIVALRKNRDTRGNSSPTQRRLCGAIPSEAKKAALKNLEDVLLEPPRAASGKSSRYLKRTRYLPDLMGDSLESYPRRVFIDVGLPENVDSGWFAKNYPTRNKDFEIYKIETVTEESSGKEVSPEIGISDWLGKNVREEDYVVMKAEAEVVEEMVKSKAIRLVDELFMECKHQGLNGKSKKSRRAYWECLALYGSLRDEGVAVHQWWG